MGGLYNMIMGYDPACFWIMPMLGRKESEWPRFRDCFVEESKEHGHLIVFFTRVGGGNRNCGYGEEKLYEDPLFVSTEDWDQDTTYAFYRFKVPEKWKEDFDKCISNQFHLLSEEYKKCLREFWPLLNEKGVIDKLFEKFEEENRKK